MKRRILFYVGYQNTPLHPKDLYEKGLGGSETAVCEIAKHLASCNEFDVVVSGDVVNVNCDNVNYINTLQLREGVCDKQFDIVIAVNYIHYLEELEFLNYTQSIFWLHNTEHFPWWRGELMHERGDGYYSDPRMSLIVCVSEWQRDIIIKKFPICADKVRVIENGIDRSVFSYHMPKLGSSRTFLYTSAPDRGLLSVIKMWPDIVRRYPDAHLKIFCPLYSVDHLKTFCDEHDVYTLSNVDVQGPINKGLLYKEIEQARYWLYPSVYEETFCITALEMMFGKTIILSTDTGNLKNLLPSCISTFRINDYKSDTLEHELINWTLSSIDYAEKMISQNPNIVEEYLSDIQSYAAKFQWRRIAHKWTSLLKPLTCEQLGAHVCIISLKPDTEYNRVMWLEQLQRVGINASKVTIFPAVDGNNIDSLYMTENDYKVYSNWCLSDSKNTWWNRDIRPGELGCAISHYQVWKFAYEQRLSNVLILEEDFNYEKELSQDVLDCVPCNWDLLYLGRNPLTDENIDPHQLVTQPGPSYNMHAYALSSTGIEKLIQQNFQQVLMPVDEFIQGTYTSHLRADLAFIWRDMHAYTVRDQVIRQTSNTQTSQTENIHKNKNTILPIDSRDFIFSYFDNQYQWCNRFLSPGVMDMDIDLMVDEPIQNVFSFQLFNEDFCRTLIDVAEKSNKWTTDRHIFYPTTDTLLSYIGFNDIYEDILRKFVEPVIRHVYQLEGDNWHNLIDENFLARYTPDTQPKLNIHHDSSNISALLNLSQINVDYTGGGTYFPKYKALHCPPQGTISVHPGCITHKHGARPVLSGSRYIVVSFMKHH